MDPRDQLVLGRKYIHDGEGLVTLVRWDDSLRRASTGTPIGVIVRCTDGEEVLTSYDALSA